MNEPLLNTYRNIRTLAHRAEAKGQDAGPLWAALDLAWEQMTPAERASTPDPS